jgi:hypothetical protein
LSLARRDTPVNLLTKVLAAFSPRSTICARETKHADCAASIPCAGIMARKSFVQARRFQFPLSKHDPNQRSHAYGWLIKFSIIRKIPCRAESSVKSVFCLRAADAASWLIKI